MKILSSISVRTGGRTITFQRIEPPPVVEPAVAPLAAAVNPSPQRMASPPVLWRARQHKMLGLSCTVRELGVTSVRWWHEGQEYGMISSIDFHWLRGLGSFAVEDREYFLFFGIGTESNRRKKPTSEPVPEFLTSKESLVTSRYIIEKAPPKGADLAAFEGIDDLHRHFDAHREELIAQAAANEEREREHAAYLKANPPVPQDVTIQYWKKDKPAKYQRVEVNP